MNILYYKQSELIVPKIIDKEFTVEDEEMTLCIAGLYCSQSNPTIEVVIKPEFDPSKRLIVLVPINSTFEIMNQIIKDTLTSKLKCLNGL